MLKLIPLGGLGEIGMNALVLECGEHRLLIDCGLAFPKADEIGVDVVLPDFSPLFEGPAALTGVVLTHAHEDHLGALPFLLRDVSMPVFATPFTLAVARHKLEEAHLTADLRTIFPRERIAVGPFLIEPVRVTHSVPDAIGLFVRTEHASLFHTGDFKLDPLPIDGQHTDTQRLAALSEEGIDLLLSDSTNAEVPGRTPSEQAVADSFERLFAEKQNRIAVALFGSHLHRVQHLLRLAQRLDRKVLLLGRSLRRNVELAQNVGLLDVPPQLFVSLEEAVRVPRRQLLIVSTGAQAEVKSGLGMLAFRPGELSLEAGDFVVVSSRAIPGNEPQVSAMVNALLERGVEVVVPNQSQVLHVSGHAAREEQAQMIELASPRHFVPVHGEQRHLQAHAGIAVAQGLKTNEVSLLRDGDVLCMHQGIVTRQAPVALTRRLMRRDGLLPLSPQALVERRYLAESGLVVVSVVIATTKGELLCPPVCAGKGLQSDETAALSLCGPAVALEFAALPSRAKALDEEVKEAVIRAVRRTLKQLCGSKPTVLATVLRA